MPKPKEPQLSLFDLQPAETIAIGTDAGEVTIQIERVGIFLAVHPTVGAKMSGRYTVTHIPTGLAMIASLPYRRAMMLANEIERQRQDKHVELDFTATTLSVDTQKALGSIVQPYLHFVLNEEDPDPADTPSTARVP